MTRELFMRDAFNSLRPLTESAMEMVKSLPRDKELWVEVKRARLGWMHRKYFALVEFVYSNLPEDMEARYPTIDRLRWELTIQTGRFDLVETLGGKQIPIAHSISFGKMEQEEFERLYRDTIRVVCKFILPGVTDDELRQHVEQTVMEFAA